MVVEAYCQGHKVTNKFIIRRAESVEDELLTRISFLSKSYWSYPDEYFQIWKQELTITSGYIEEHEVFVCEVEEEVCAYYSLVQLVEDMLFSGTRLQKGLWLDHMFVLPEHMGRRIGRKLFHHCCTRLAAKEAECLNILSDPNAEGFYLKMGCVSQGNLPSSIPGRTTPYLIWER